LNDKELDAFAKACNGKPFDKEAKEEIKENFNGKRMSATSANES
jgi:hypothetical protein